MNNLKRIRQEKKLTQTKLAELSEVNLRMIQKYENGERDINGASALTVYKIAKALGCSVGDLLNL